ncbi:hypothetical protein [Pseudomonas sp. NBRC 111118]|uniref:hypothetical protein n=1 Tax=Pseudomonas sp. NBRC 111118 TaxID=1661033 RepID=UPI001C46EA28|nr:hypothetical protein [Pseudomonas sp. NBRC 111118]
MLEILDLALALCHACAQLALEREQLGLAVTDGRQGGYQFVGVGEVALCHALGGGELLLQALGL